MADTDDEINLLLEKLEVLLRKQNDFSQEIKNLQEEIYKLKASKPFPSVRNEKQGYLESVGGKTADTPKENVKPAYEYFKQQARKEPPKLTSSLFKKPPKSKSDLEKFIGENLANKIGIAITVIGVAIGAKYAIDHQLISPLTRIILGYLIGLGLLAFSIKLKKKYENFSAVLLSGAMAIMYFITYAAYDFYSLIPQLLAFGLMVIFTVFTVIAAINYDRQVIAIIGLVGAYAVPFLLSDGSGRVVILLTYMAIINIGILIIAFNKYWKSLYYSAFGFTWLIYFSWFVFDYQESEHFYLALTFLSSFFIIFYLAFLGYKLVKKEKFEMQDVILLLTNSFIFYGIGYALLKDNRTGKELLGLFTLLNAFIHFVIGMVIYRQKLADKNLFYLVAGLVLVYITIAIPVQLDENWVTLLWAGEAAVLFWIGRTKNVAIYEKMSYPLMILAFMSIIHDWQTLYGNGTKITPLLNINFFSSLFFVAAFAFINKLYYDKKYKSPFVSQKGIVKAFKYFIPAILLIAVYFAFRIEIANYWNQLYDDSFLKITTRNNQYPDYLWNHDLKGYKIIWIINYTLLFVSVLAFVNLLNIKNQRLGVISIVLIVLTIAIFLGQGLYMLSELRESYLQQTLSKYYHRRIFNIGVRYISITVAVIALIACYQAIKKSLLQIGFKAGYDIFLHISVLWILSSELLNWMDIAKSTQSYKLGLSILWGVYSLFLISLGIWKKKKHLRIGAIVLFGFTLIKLFFYDMVLLDTIAKTVVLVSLGILLLIISFLYNKYKYVISGEIEKQNSGESV